MNGIDIVEIKSILDWNNNKLPHDGSRILCSNDRIHNEMIKVLTKKEYNLFF